MVVAEPDRMGIRYRVVDSGPGGRVDSAGLGGPLQSAVSLRVVAGERLYAAKTPAGTAGTRRAGDCRVAPGGLAAHSKKVRRERRNLIFIDESGLLMSPLVRRTWAPRGHRPVLYQRGRHREKVSLAAALWLSPQGDPERVSYRLLSDSHFNNEAVAAFLTDLIGMSDQPVTVIWDGGNMHRGQPIRDLLTRERGRVHLERLPAYAPMLNPVEQLWSWLKYSRLCNYAPHNVGELHGRAQKELNGIRRSRKRMRSFWNACDLSKGGH